MSQQVTAPQTPLADIGREVLTTSKSVRSMRENDRVSRKMFVVILLIYLGVAVLSAPLILFPDIGDSLHWDRALIAKISGAIRSYNNKSDGLIRFWSCLGILLLPLLGFWRAWTLGRTLGNAGAAAASIDDSTTQYRSDPAMLSEKYRHQLHQAYEAFEKWTGPGNVQAVAIMADALRLAGMDRWERASAIVDTQAPALLSGIGLLNALQRIALQLGILFTFVGLTMALSTEAFRGTREVANVDLNPLIGALQVAFCSSIAGLIASISLIMMAGHARLLGQRVILQLEAMADNILNLAKLLDADPKVINDLSEIRRANQRLSNDVAGMRTQFSDAMRTTNEAMTVLQKELQLATEAQSAFRSFFSGVQKDELVRNIREGVVGGAHALTEKINANAETTEKLIEATEKLVRLEIERVDNLNQVKAQLKDIRRLLRAAPPGATTVTGALLQTLNRVLTFLSRTK